MKIYGLALLCSNPRGKSVQIGFIGMHHDPIHFHVFDPNGNDYIDFRGQNHKEYHILIQKSIVRTQGNFYEDGRMFPKDSKDFRWMPDMHRLHPGSKIKPGVSAQFSAILELSDAVFYTADKANNDAILSETNNLKPTIKEKFGRLLGADIACEENDTGVNISIFEGGDLLRGYPKELDKRSKPWTMEIHTKTQGGDHMDMLYGCLDDTGAYKYSLKYNVVRERALVSRCADVRSNEYAGQPFSDGDGPF